ncbi:MAG: YeeE/YedE family protein [Proteobacteria bacterium]|nr:YeeE/YedE family protein [Pseudomonadota bacterium]
MGELSVVAKVGWLAFTLGIAFGATAQRTNFCTMGAISDMVMMDDRNRLRAWLLAIAVGIAASQGLHLAGLVDLNKAIYLTPNLGWAGAVIGGLMFGFGMTQAGGCGSKTLIRLGAGNLKSLYVAVVLGIFAYMTLRGVLALVRTALEGATNVDLKASGVVNNQGLPDLLAATGLEIGSARMILAAAAVALLVWYCFKDGDFRQSKRDVIAGLIIGLTVPAGWAITGIAGFDEFQPTPLFSLTFVAPVGNSLQYLMTFTGATIDFGVASVGGVIAGSFLAAMSAKEFRVESFVDADDMIRHTIGAALMGTGGVLALGCTIGQGLTGMSTLAVGSVLALGSIIAGGVLGIRYLEEGTLGGALKAMLARS